MRYYFCYSSALDSQSLNQWKQQHGYPDFQLANGKKARARDLRFCFDFPSRFWGGRVLSLTSAPASEVEGILFEIPDEKNWHIVGHKEGTLTGASEELEVQVQCEGRVLTATAFVTHPSKRSLVGPVSQSFIDSLKRAYEQWGLNFEPLTKLD